MKHILLGLITCWALVACSSDHDGVIVDPDLNTDLITVEFPVVASDTTLRKDTVAGKYEDVRSRAWEVLSLPKLYLISNYTSKKKRNVLELDVHGTGTERTTRFCLFIRGGKVFASNKVDEIPLEGGCILSSVGDRVVNTQTSKQITTPSGKKVDEPFGDRLFKSAEFTFSHKADRYGDASGDHETIIYYIDYAGNKYSNESGSFQTGGIFSKKYLAFALNRYTSKVKANLIITDYTLGLISILERPKFEIVTGTTMNKWSFCPFITKTANTYDTVDEKASGSATFPLLASPQVFEEGQYSWFTGGVYYEGIGKRFFNEDGYAYLLPKLGKSPKLCYSFYYSGTNKQYRAYNTLEVKLDNIVLDPNVENEITTIFHVNDLIEAMKLKSKSRAGFVTHEDPDFGTVMEIPHEVLVTYK